jgi:hypothetical protein
MLDEDILAQQRLILLDNQTTIDSKPRLSIFQKIKKNNKNIICDVIIAVIFVVCIIATFVIIICNNSKIEIK